jgi:hypothetical protein
MEFSSSARVLFQGGIKQKIIRERPLHWVIVYMQRRAANYKPKETDYEQAITRR